MGLCDFHIHSKYSDGSLEISEIVDLYGKRGFSAICITDHLCETDKLLGKAAHVLNKSLNKNNFQSYLQEIEVEAKRAKKLYDLLVLPGVEITKNSISHKDSAHLLGINIHEYIDPNLGIEQACEEIRRQGALSVAAHPVSTRKFEHQTYQLWDRREYFSNFIDLWEVASGAHLFSEVFQSGLPIIANSDLHRPQQIFSWKTEIPNLESLDQMMESIRNQNIGFYYYKECENVKSNKSTRAFEGIQSVFKPSKEISRLSYC